MSDEPEVLDQHPVEARLLRLVLAAQHGGGMKRGDRLLRPARGEEPAAVPEQAEIGGDDRARRRRAEADEHLGLDRRDLGLHPGAAGRQLAQARRLVDAALAALDELEVLDRVRDVEPLPVQAHLDQRAVEHLARRADERRALQILLVAWLLADEDDAGIGGAAPEDRLGRVTIEGAARAAGRRRAQLGEPGANGNERRSARALLLELQRFHLLRALGLAPRLWTTSSSGGVVPWKRQTTMGTSQISHSAIQQISSS